MLYWRGKVPCSKPASSSAAGAPEPEEVRAQLAAILATRRFRQAGIQKDLLRYVVEHALREDPAALREDAIAAAVFGRGDSYDPQTDAVVRLVADRLRKNLDAYYSRRRRTRIRIDLPRGSYSPVFTRRTPGALVRRVALAVGVAAIVALAVSGTSRPHFQEASAPHEYRSLAILPLENVEVDPYVASTVANLAEKLRGYGGLRVVGEVPPDIRGDTRDMPAVARRLSVEALLEGGIQFGGQNVQIGLALVDGRDGRTFWRDLYESQRKDLPSMIDDIAYAVGTALGATGKQ